MFTTFDKALAALVMALLYFVNVFTGFSIGLDEQTISTILSAVTPMLVWLIPNKEV